MLYNTPTIHNTPTIYNTAGGVYNSSGVYNDGAIKVLLDTICNTCDNNKDVPIIGKSEIFTDYTFLNPGYKFEGSSRLLYDNLNGAKKFRIKCSGENSMIVNYSFRTPFNLCVACFDSGLPYNAFKNKLCIWNGNVNFQDYTTNAYNEKHGTELFILLGNGGDIKTIDFEYNETTKKLNVVCESINIEFNNIDRNDFINQLWLKSFGSNGKCMYLYEAFAST